MGGAGLVGTIRNMSLRIRIRHTAIDTLPNITGEPVVCEGSTVQSHLTHELVENSQGWEFRPLERVWRNIKRFLIGFGVPCFIIFSGILTWILHSKYNIANWPVSAVLGTILTTLSFGLALLLMGMMVRSDYRRLSKLTIPRNGNNMELDEAEAPNWEKTDIAEALKWSFIGGTKRQLLAIPRGTVIAVQLCPWKFALRRTNGRTVVTWAVQGILVLASPETDAYRRVPVLLTGDCVKAAQLMQRLAHILQVPYLFYADAAGCKAEEIRAKSRVPLRTGGVES
jgi:hypothetical protein